MHIWINFLESKAYATAPFGPVYFGTKSYFKTEAKNKSFINKVKVV